MFGQRLLEDQKCFLSRKESLSIPCEIAELENMIVSPWVAF